MLCSLVLILKSLIIVVTVVISCSVLQGLGPVVIASPIGRVKLEQYVVFPVGFWGDIGPS